MRLRFSVAYDGTHFHGWAAQPGLRTVQGELTDIVETIFQQQVEMIVAGRTDAGVHARAQVFQIDVDNSAPLDITGTAMPAPQPQLVRRVNKMLASRGINDIVIRHCELTFPQFNARFCAQSRTYSYLIGDSVDTWIPTRTDIARIVAPLDVQKMNDAAQSFVGEHDFLAYAKPREGASTIREVLSYNVRRDLTTGIIESTVVGDAFCHSQVRFMTGALIEIGRGRRDANWLRQGLDSGKRPVGLQLAAPEGLTLVGVDYPERPEDMEAQQRKAQRFRG